MHREFNAIKKIKHQHNSVNFFISEHIKKRSIIFQIQLLRLLVFLNDSEKKQLILINRN